MHFLRKALFKPLKFLKKLIKHPMATIQTQGVDEGTRDGVSTCCLKTSGHSGSNSFQTAFKQPSVRQLSFNIFLTQPDSFQTAFKQLSNSLQTTVWNKNLFWLKTMVFTQHVDPSSLAPLSTPWQTLYTTSNPINSVGRPFSDAAVGSGPVWARGSRRTPEDRNVRTKRFCLGNCGPNGKIPHV